MAMPPEVHAISGPALAILLLVGHLCARDPLPLAPVVVTLALAALNAAASLAPGVTTGLLPRAAFAVATFALAWRLAADARRIALVALVVTGAALAIFALLQTAIIMPADAIAARAMDLPPAFALRLESGRPFATHVVPAALGGALVLALFAAAALLAEPRGGRAARLALGVAATITAAGLVATTSIGAFAGLLAGLVPAALVLARRAPRRHVVTAAVVLAIAALAIAAFRVGPLLDIDDPRHPLAERIGNWRGALVLAERLPFAGQGLGAFRSLYPGVMRAGDVETAYAHNSWLQLALEGGIPMLALLVAAAWWLVRRARRPGEGASLWLFGGTLAFAAHNLVDFTAYLPGVVVPAAVLAAFAATAARAEPNEPDDEEHRDDFLQRRLPVAIVAVVLLGVAGLTASEAIARRALERAHDARLDDRIEDAQEPASRALAAAPWSAPLTIDAARLLALADAARGAEPATALATFERAARLDPESPAAFHAQGDAHLAARRPAAAWRAWRSALDRHPASDALRAKVESAETALRDAGLLLAPLTGFERAPPRAPRQPSTRWDDLLLLSGLVLAAVVAFRWWRGGAAPASAIALAFALVIATAGAGGALAGVRVAWGLLVALALVAAFVDRTPRAPRAVVLDPALALLGLAAAMAALSTALAPDRAAARDGLAMLVLLLGACALSFAIASRHPAWPRVVAGVFGLAASAQAALWIAQRSLVAFGVDLAALPHPLRADPAQPAADFLHPGQLGTYLVAAGAALAVAAFLAAPVARGRALWGLALVALGLAQSARASVLALGGIAVALALLPLDARLRRALRGGLVALLVLGAAFVAWRFATKDDPYAWSRVEIWRASVEALTDRPLLGFGPGGFAPFAPEYARPDPTAVARYGKIFRGPHSDLLGAPLAFGVPGALALFVAIGLLLARAIGAARSRGREEPLVAGALVAVFAFAAHALVDDILTDRPAAALAAALLLGAAAGRGRDAPRAEPAPSPWASLGTRRALAVAVLTLAGAGLVAPWLADRFAREDLPHAAARLDPRRAAYWAAVSRAEGGATPAAIGAVLTDAERAVLATPASASAWRARARALDAACRGALSQREVCAEARDAWTRVAERAPHDVFALRMRARMHLLLDAPTDAERDLRAALAQEPHYLGARLDLARLVAREGRAGEAAELRDEARRTFERFRETRPENARDASLLALTQREAAEMLSIAPPRDEGETQVDPPPVATLRYRR